MSVILDALRRDRRKREVTTSTSRPMATRLPTGLGLGASPPVPVRSNRMPWVALTALGVISFIAWTAIHIVRGRTAVDSPPPSTVDARPTPSVAAVPSRPAPVPAATVPSAQPSQPESATQPVRTLAPDPRSRDRAERPSRASNHFEQALRAQSAGNLDDAARDYRAAIADDARNLEARNNLGLLYRSRGLTSEAIEQFRQALAIDPRYVNARNSLAALLMDSGRFAEARDELTAGLAVDSRNVDLLVNLALVENSAQHSERAIELLLRAVGDRPAHAAAHYNLALLYDQRGAFALAYDHYADFLTYAGPEYRAVVPDVRRRLEAITPLVSSQTK